MCAAKMRAAKSDLVASWLVTHGLAKVRVNWYQCVLRAEASVWVMGDLVPGG